jgi:hypothetical protein
MACVLHALGNLILVMPRDDQLLDLLGALEDVEDLGVARPLLEQLGLAVADAAGRARRSLRA